MGFGTTVPNRLGHWRGFMPDDVLTEYPTVSLKGQSYPPRSSNKITGWKIDSTSASRPRLFPTLSSAFPKTPSGNHITTTDFACTIGISEIQPESPVIPKHPMDQREYLYHLVDELVGSLLQSDLPNCLVIPQAPIGRTRYDHLDGLLGQTF